MTLPDDELAAFHEAADDLGERLVEALAEETDRDPEDFDIDPDDTDFPDLDH